jgi:hypothetical protein
MGKQFFYKVPTTNFPNFGGKILDLHLEQGIIIVDAIHKKHTGMYFNYLCTYDLKSHKEVTNN